MKRLLTAKAMTAILILLLAGLLYRTAHLAYRSYDTNRDIDKLKKEVESQQAQQKKLEEFRAFIQTDFFAEKEARLKLGMQRNNEHVVVVPPYSERRALPAGARVNGADEQGEVLNNEKQKRNPLLWWEYFFAPDFPEK